MVSQDSKFPESLWTEVQLAEYLRTSVKTIRNERCSGRSPIPYVKVGRLVRYEPAAIREFIAAARRRNTSDQGGKR
jgi:Helix-turn-helix domain